jgi:predicted AAA+ superfamily ATPase
LTFYYRDSKPKILAALNESPVVFVNGPRQAGKSTLVEEIANVDFPADYITFDNPTQMAAATMAPQAFLSQRTRPLIIDEVQLVPEIFRAMKVYVDNLRRDKNISANGRLLLTGSANILALPQLADALVGRMRVITLYPFSCTEAIGTKGDCIARLFAQDFTNLDQTVSLMEAIRVATFPEISHKEPSVQNNWFEGYITTLLQRDVRMLAELEKIALLPALLRVLAIRAGSLINDADIARDLGLNAMTERNYRHILQMMFLSFDVKPWFRNLGKRLVKSPKGFLIDTLLLCYLLDSSPEDLAFKKPEIFGHVLENFIATELLKLLSFSDIRAQLFHFRTSDGKEVDFVLEKTDGHLLGIEIKSSENISANDFKGLKELAQLAKDDFVCGIVLYGGQDVVPFGDKLWAVPFQILWQ